MTPADSDVCPDDRNNGMQLKYSTSRVPTSARNSRTDPIVPHLSRQWERRYSFKLQGIPRRCCRLLPSTSIKAVTGRRSVPLQRCNGRCSSEYDQKVSLQESHLLAVASRMQPSRAVLQGSKSRVCAAPNDRHAMIWAEVGRCQA